MKPPIQHHMYVSDGVPDGALKPQDRCAQCGLPRSNPRHKLPEVPQEVLDAEARRLGEPG